MLTTGRPGKCVNNFLIATRGYVRGSKLSATPANVMRAW